LEGTSGHHLIEPSAESSTNFSFRSGSSGPCHTSLVTFIHHLTPVIFENFDFSRFCCYD